MLTIGYSMAGMDKIAANKAMMDMPKSVADMLAMLTDGHLDTQVMELQPLTSLRVNLWIKAILCSAAPQAGLTVR